MSDHEYLQDVSPDRLAGLIFELAAQLHVERAHRMALERALAEAGVLAQGAVLDPGPQAAVALDRSVRALLRVVTEAGDTQAPLRAEALGAPDQG